ncbi:MAG TPA: hydrolase 1, exosortase A system-associated [Allosphingosinicella sp.]|nr:hydrolase 1, exosortase A system-associated [Allosphingosinicella sp.]
MRRLLSFACEDALLGATLDGAEAATGLLIVTGGSQTRIGSHRMFERLALALSGQGYPAFRFDRRGIGDSEGEDRGFRGSAADLSAAVQAFRSECPRLRQVIGFGLCDGATALALFGAATGLDGLILANPWLVEAEADAPPPAAIKRHYLQQLTSRAGWRKVLTGSVSYRKLFKGLSKVASARPSSLAGDVADMLIRHKLSVAMILARSDATAVAAEAEWRSPRFRGVREAALPVTYVETDSHTFARPGDDAALLAACLQAIKTMATSGRL